jgi:hypothetical protein
MKAEWLTIEEMATAIESGSYRWRNGLYIRIEEFLATQIAQVIAEASKRKAESIIQ